jgi:hypothetical protein
MCHSVFVSFYYFQRGDCCVAVEECDGPLETSMWAALCHCLVNLRFIPRVTFHQPSLIDVN